MVKIYVDGKEVEVDPKKNLILALKEKGIYIPHFCYHPKLSIVGMCRICLIEIEGVPKLQIACNTPIKEGMRILVNSERAKKAREEVMEFLLINHPLDCPVCDKAGECDLQDYAYAVGHYTTRYKEPKRNIAEEPIGTNLLINHNRCILCYRCVRFDREIVGVHDLEMVSRGNKTIIAYVPPIGKEGKLLDHNYQGALADICPVGALLNKNMLFKSRVWWYEEKQSICHGCSTLCRVTVNIKENKIYRYMPPEDPEKNGYFICDWGRFHTEEFSQKRLFRALYKGEERKFYKEVLPVLLEKIEKSSSLVLLGGTTESIEDVESILSTIEKWKEEGKEVIWEFRTLEYMYKGEWDKMEDFLMSIDKRPNSNYLRERISTSFSSLEDLIPVLEKADLIFILNEFSMPYAYTLEEEEKYKEHPLYKLLEKKNLWDKVILLNTHANEATKKALFSIPIRAFVEKSAHYISRNRERKRSVASIEAPIGLLSSGELFSKLMLEKKKKEDKVA